MPTPCCEMKQNPSFDAASTQARAAMDVTNVFILVTSPGAIAAFGPGVPAAGTALRVGATTEQALGMSWNELVELGASRGRRACALGALAVVLLHSESGTPVSAIVTLAGNAALSAHGDWRRPLPLEAVRGRDVGAARAIYMAERLFKIGLPLYVSGEPGSGMEVVALHVCARTHSALLRIRVGTDDLFAEPVANAGTLLVERLNELGQAEGERLASELSEGMFRNWQLVGCGAPLDERQSRGAFSADLAALLRTTTVVLPPLRMRDDLDFLASAVLQADGVHDVAFSSASIRVLGSKSWPGNFAEFRAVVAQVAASARDGQVRDADIPRDPAQPGGDVAPDGRLRRQAEHDALTEALSRAGGNLSRTARTLGVARSTLYRLLTLHGLSRRSK